jgi:hypothetical protein
MTNVPATSEPAEPPRRPSVIAPTSRVNIALPFSKFELRELSHETVELVTLVADLIAAIEVATPTAELTQLRQRAAGLVARCS